MIDDLDRNTLRFVRDEILNAYTAMETRVLIALMLSENNELFSKKLDFAVYGDRSGGNVRSIVQLIRTKRGRYDIVYADRRFKLVLR